MQDNFLVSCGIAMANGKSYAKQLGKGGRREDRAKRCNQKVSKTSARHAFS